jgi:hypothetical protein
MGMAWHSMWKRLVLVYQLTIWEAAMVEPWDGVGKAAMARTHKAQVAASGWVRSSHQR